MLLLLNSTYQHSHISEKICDCVFCFIAFILQMLYISIILLIYFWSNMMLILFVFTAAYAVIRGIFDVFNYVFHWTL